MLPVGLHSPWVRATLLFFVYLFLTAKVISAYLKSQTMQKHTTQKVQVFGDESYYMPQPPGLIPVLQDHNESPFTDG